MSKWLSKGGLTFQHNKNLTFKGFGGAPSLTLQWHPFPYLPEVMQKMLLVIKRTTKLQQKQKKWKRQIEAPGCGPKQHMLLLLQSSKSFAKPRGSTNKNAPVYGSLMNIADWCANKHPTRYFYHWTQFQVRKAVFFQVLNWGLVIAFATLTT